MAETDPFYSYGDRIKKTPTRREETSKTFDDARKKGAKQGVFVAAGETPAISHRGQNAGKFKTRAGKSKGIKTQGNQHIAPQTSSNPYQQRSKNERLQTLIAERARKM